MSTNRTTDHEKLRNGWVHTVTIAAPTLQDNTADADRLTGALQRKLSTDPIGVELSFLKCLPELLRDNRFTVKCVLFKENGRWTLVHVAAPDSTETLAGLAVDLGTTRVVLRLVDLESGNTLAESAFDNPQLSFGPEILSRIHYGETAEGLSQLNRLIIEGLNINIRALCSSSNLSPSNIHLMTVAGNTAMTHLLLGLNPRWLIREPYIPVVNRPGVFKTRDLGISVSPAARVLVFPNVGSYFGGDLIAGILFTGIHTRQETAILVDVGTNAEVVLGNRNWLIACAGAAGPALEGGVSKMGMMAGSGVIDRVNIDPDTGDVAIGTIDHEPPVGICGSGVIDLAAQLFSAGMVDIRGKFDPLRCGRHLKSADGLDRFVLVSSEHSGTGEDLCFSQVDMDSLIRSKAAMYTILETIAGTVGMDLKDIVAFYVAGTFGSFIKPASAVTIGMIPDLPLERFRAVGNSSLGGGALVLTDADALESIDRIRNSVTYLELNVNQDFMNRFSAAKFIPHTDRSRFPSVVVPPSA